MVWYTIQQSQESTFMAAMHTEQLFCIHAVHCFANRRLSDITTRVWGGERAGRQ